MTGSLQRDERTYVVFHFSYRYRSCRFSLIQVRLLLYLHYFDIQRAFMNISEFAGFASLWQLRKIQLYKKSITPLNFYKHLRSSTRRGSRKHSRVPCSFLPPSVGSSTKYIKAQSDFRDKTIHTFLLRFPSRSIAHNALRAVKFNCRQTSPRLPTSNKLKFYKSMNIKLGR